MNGLALPSRNGQLQRVDLDYNVVDAKPRQGGENVFRGRDQNSLAHEAGGVTDTGNVLPGGRNLKVVQIRAPKQDSLVCQRRDKTNPAGRGAVQSNAGEPNRLVNGVLVVQSRLFVYLPQRIRII